ncbi:single-stranded DNA-binding protein [Commensalibacter sp. TBRC 16381]|uniref:Single-stranded DNA-binding protein n=1 Tax=Commensalibacter oyaizuii TaxID=3043873 RepID=A0ABT6Q3C3_9PROT|nr:single-stranded DNA-binding protein [Commensalibacter sp. TBRC 16381]MDI2091605.1 single-stranded DNA-binding protein [Commensalibacter sp. TBRC 16381]
MAGSVNKVILVGNLGYNPEIRTQQSGSKIASLTIATSEHWKDRQTDEWRENTQWHRVVIFNERLVNLAEKHLTKGRKVFIEGQLKTRKWIDREGVERYTTEIVLTAFRGELVLLDSKDQKQSSRKNQQQSNQDGWDSSMPNDLNDEIPF